MVVNESIEMLSKAQKASINLAAETITAVARAGKAGLTQPDEILNQMAALLGAAGDLAGYAVQPLQTFIERQRELADTMVTLAELHSQLADVVSTVARHHAGVVDALEALSSPLLAFAKEADVIPDPPQAKKSRSKARR